MSYYKAGIIFGINIGDKIGIFLIKAQSLNYSVTPSYSVIPFYINKTISTSSNSEITWNDRPLNISPFISNIKKLRADPEPFIIYLILLGAIGDGLGLFLF